MELPSLNWSIRRSPTRLVWIARYSTATPEAIAELTVRFACSAKIPKGGVVRLALPGFTAPLSPWVVSPAAEDKFAVSPVQCLDKEKDNPLAGGRCEVTDEAPLNGLRVDIQSQMEVRAVPCLDAGRS